MANIVDKYFNKKKKQILDYCKIINLFLKYDNNQIWKTPAELNEIMRSSISVYIDNYYFKSMESFDEYSEYLGDLVKCDNRFKTILVCSINSIPEELKTGNYKISSYIMALIIYAGVVLDRFTYPYNSYKINIKNVTTITHSIFKNINFVSYSETTKNRSDLLKLIKKNDNVETKFYKSLNSLNNPLSKNVYESMNDENRFYKINYKYEIPELNNYSEKDVSKILKRVTDDLNCLSYELATLTILKSKMLDKNVTLLFSVNLDFYEKQSEINKLFKITLNENIKKSIKFLIDYEDYKKHTGLIRVLSNAGFTMALNFNKVVEVEYNTFNDIKLAFIEKEFLDINDRHVNGWKNNDVEFVVKNKNEEETEAQMLGLKEE